MEDRIKQIEHYDGELSMKRACMLLGVARSQIYYRKKGIFVEDVDLMNLIRDIYERYPFYGYRRIHATLQQMGCRHNRKKTQRLMSLAGMQAIYRRKNTSLRNQAHKVFPYLLKDLKIERPNHVWEVDITYIKLRYGFVYLVCLIDVYSRRIMGSALSTSIETEVCLNALEKALTKHTPEIINSDQGCQFTSLEWIEMLKQEGILISMDGKGRWADNITIERFWRSLKYEAVYLQCFETVEDARIALANYIEFYNTIRPHQTLNYKTPDQKFNDWFDTNQALTGDYKSTVDNPMVIQIQQPITGGSMAYL